MALVQKNTQKTKTKPKPEDHSAAPVSVCVHDCVDLLWYTTQHRTVQIIFPVILQTIVVEQMLPIEKRGISYRENRKTRGGSSPNILGGGGIAPISPFITESIFSVLRNQKNTNFMYAYI